MSDYRSGFIAVMGRPNVGKSTLINRLLGQTIAAVSPKPQTTRLQQLGILTTESAQLVFIDTPGLHNPQHRLGEYMNEAARQALDDCDLGLLLVNASKIPPDPEDHLLGKILRESGVQIPFMLVLNKIELVLPPDRAPARQAYQPLLPEADLISISARTGEGIDQLLSKLIQSLPEGPPLYPEDQITDLYEREIAADLIRAAAMLHLHYELPHSIAVRMDEFKERGDQGAYIAATIFVERDSQKGIVIGEKGKMIKEISISARKEIEAMSGRKVYLDLRVKVRPNWRNDDNALRLFGFKKSKS